MDWFQQLTGFRETDYESTRARLAVEGGRLRSLVNGMSYATGDFELASLDGLRDRAQSSNIPNGRLKVSVVVGDVRELKQRPEYAGAVFQVASQFNMLEMISPRVTPEDGVTRYAKDHTQGPACAIAAGAATIYRNYFVPTLGGCGQTRDRQINGLADIGEALSSATGRPVGELWQMENGYALCTAEGLKVIADYLGTSPPRLVDELRGKLRIGLHRDVEVTSGEGRPLISQAFCSALPVAYSSLPRPLWEPFASLVLEAAYEATMWSAVMNAHRGTSNIVLLTLLGGGAFGNDDRWIHNAIRRALQVMAQFDVDVRIVSYRGPSQDLARLVFDFQP